VSRWTSAHLIGRVRELELMDEALDAARRGQARVLLVGAEAGAGKTRLLQEFAKRAGSSALVLEGRCVEQRDGALSYAPFVGLIRHLVRQQGLEHVSTLIDKGAAADIAALAPMLSRTSEREPSRVRLFDGVVTLVDALAVEQPLVLIIEDVHWSDPATKDLLLYLASNLEGAGVVLVISHRGAGPSSSMSTFRVAMLRLAHTRSISLSPLSMDQTEEQLSGILATRPPPAVVREVYDRSGGLPIFTEALIRSDGSVREAIPGHLRELIIAEVQELPRSTQEAMHAASVGGSVVDADLLAAVVGVDPAQLARQIKPAVRSGLVVADEAGYRFRHELLREAVRDGELLPGERAALHRSYAEAMESHAAWDPERGRDGRIALHWRGALDHERALRTSWDVALRAHAAGAYVDELRMLEQVLAVWGRAAEPAASIGTDRIHVLEAAVDAACWAAQSYRGLALAEAALELLAESGDGGRRASMLLQHASLRQQLMLPGYVDDLAEASRIHGVDPAARAEILGQLARAWFATEGRARAVETADELRRLAGEGAAPAARLESLATDVLLGLGGRHPDGIALLRQVIADATDLGLGWIEALGWMSVVRLAVREGAYGEAIELGRQALRRLRELGLVEYSGAEISSGLAAAQLARGQRAAALDTIHEALTRDPAPNGRAALLLVDSEVHLRGGVAADAERALADFDVLVTGRHPEPALLRLRARLGPEVARMRGELARPTMTRHGLTAREVEVLTLLADGLSNKEIASRLVISAKTASVHVSNILRKLDVPARGAAVALAYRQAIIDVPVGVAPRE